MAGTAGNRRSWPVPAVRRLWLRLGLRGRRLTRPAHSRRAEPRPSPQLRSPSRQPVARGGLLRPAGEPARRAGPWQRVRDGQSWRPGGAELEDVLVRGGLSYVVRASTSTSAGCDGFELRGLSLGSGCRNATGCLCRCRSRHVRPCELPSHLQQPPFLRSAHRGPALGCQCPATLRRAVSRLPMQRRGGTHAHTARRRRQLRTGRAGTRTVRGSHGGWCRGGNGDLSPRGPPDHRARACRRLLVPGSWLALVPLRARSVTLTGQEPGANQAS